MSNSVLKVLPILILVVLQVRGQRGNSCVRTHDGSSGIWKLPRECQSLLDEFNRGIKTTKLVTPDGSTLICCLTATRSAIDNRMGETPSFRPTPDSAKRIFSNKPTKRISLQKCEEYTSALDELEDGDSGSACESATPLISGGNEAQLGEFPHMAAIGYQKRQGIAFQCGGSLISKRFVLTAAHCHTINGVQPHIVRLGDLNLRNNNDGSEEIDARISRFIIHDDYDPASIYSDIALVKLRNKIIFTLHIRPACLTQSKDISANEVIATGWGSLKTHGATSDDLMKVKLDVVERGFCNQRVKSKFMGYGVLESQICAGDIGGNKDTCNGDSGGPIQIVNSNNNCMYDIVGITSFGSRECGDKTKPAVFTRVASYLDWIETQIW